MAEQALDRWPAVQALFGEQPLDSAMPELLPRSRRHDSTVASASIRELGENPELQAGLWLYLDDLEASHAMSQTIAGAVGAYWHGIMHRREGDFSNAKYWLRQASNIDLGIEGYDPLTFVDQVEAAGGSNPPQLVSLQRAEWLGLFNYCAERIGELPR